MGKIFEQNLHQFPGGFRGGVEPLDEAGSRFMSRVQLEPAPGFITGQVWIEIPGTPRPLATDPTPVRRVVIRALKVNQDPVYVGNADIWGVTGFPLEYGQPDLVLFVSDLSSIFITGDTAGDGVAYIAEVPLEAFE